MSPSQVKKREYSGIVILISGCFLVAAGALGLFFAWPLALLLLGIGAAGVVTGGVTLASIPDLVHTPDESW
jgi:predicted membrane channel-forming protein YqfA (hemolysin III family)